VTRVARILAKEMAPATSEAYLDSGKHDRLLMEIIDPLSFQRIEPALDENEISSSFSQSWAGEWIGDVETW